eukprot:157344_1
MFFSFHFESNKTTSVEEPEHLLNRNRVMYKEDYTHTAIRYNKMQADATESVGSGFYGKRISFDYDEPAKPSPNNCGETFMLIKMYLNYLKDSPREQRKIIILCDKLQNELHDLMTHNKMSYYAYSSLLEAFNALKTHQYDNSLRVLTVFTMNKMEKFAP